MSQTIHCCWTYEDIKRFLVIYKKYNKNALYFRGSIYNINMRGWKSLFKNIKNKKGKLIFPKIILSVQNLFQSTAIGLAVIIYSQGELIFPHLPKCLKMNIYCVFTFKPFRLSLIHISMCIRDRLCLVGNSFIYP